MTATMDITKEKRPDEHMPAGTITNPTLAQQILNEFDAQSGLHPDFRPAHAKGLMCSGTFMGDGGKHGEAGNALAKPSNTQAT